jgi:uncharacterized protein YsxB (DUF464 family)
MVEVRIRRDSRSRLSSFLATGHAGWADPGSDVVCAAVSTVLQSAWVGLRDVAQAKPTGRRSEGRLLLSWPKESRSDRGVRAIVETAARSIEYLAKQHPRHVKVVTEPADETGKRA